MLRFLGCVLIALFGFFLSRALVGEEKRRVARLGELLGVLRAVRAEIACFRRPLSDILARTEVVDGEVRAYLRACADGGADTARADTLSLGEAAEREAAAFFRDAGSTLSGETLSACDYHIGRLAELFETAEKNAPTKEKLIRTVTLAGTALLLILLI